MKPTMRAKKYLFVLLLAGWIVWLGAAVRAGAALDDAEKQKAALHTPIPPYPEAARNLHQQGSGVLRFTTDVSGKVASAYMLRSTGSDLLDQNALAYARAKWRALPNSKINVPITYRLDHLDAANAGHTAGHGLVRVTFDSKGRAVAAKMKQSTGNKLLDDNTIKYALANWTGTPNGTQDVPIFYTMR